MKKTLLTLFMSTIFVGIITSNARAVTIDLFEYAFNIDGVVTEPTFGDPIPAEVDISAFNTASGLGTIDVTISGPGPHTIDLFVDHEIDGPLNTYYNEYGVGGTGPVAGQSWEIDEPGFVFGNIFDNFLNSSLDNTNNVPAGSEDDVSMALGWDFALLAGETADISFLVSTLEPNTSFFLTQTDPDSDTSIFFSSTLNISNSQSVPLPSSVFLIGLGLVGLGFVGKKKKLSCK